MFPDFDFLYDLGFVSPGNPLDDAYREWYDSITAGDTPATASIHGHGVKVWIVIRLRSKGFSDHLDYNEEFGMYIPKKGYGELWGIATNPEQVEQLVEGTKQQSESSFVFLVYKVRIRGEEQWGGLLDFLARGQMIEQHNT